MKVVFLQKDSFVKIAIEQLSAVLKKDGHDCDLFIESGEKDFLKSALESKPDLYAFSCTTGGEVWVEKTASELRKNCSIPTIVGGPHTTFFPQIIEQPFIDYICKGEGEMAILDLLDCMYGNPDGIRKIQNIWSKDHAGKIYENDVRPFQDLDKIPFPDFGIYTKYNYVTSYNREMFPVITGRGCPYDCSYCFNKTYKEIYKNKGKYLRRRGHDSVVQELQYAIREYGIRKINFVDDSFFQFPSWLKEFAGPYKRLVDLPFTVNLEATQVKEELVHIIRDMGCICVRMGVETGNEHLRRNVLNKKVTNKQIKEAAGFIKQCGIKLTTYNILGLPDETVENALETYELNKEIRADFAWCSLLQPYHGTAVNKYVVEKGLFEDGNDVPVMNESFFVSTKIKLRNENELINLQKLIQIFVQMRIVPLSVIRLIISLPQNPIFRLLFKIGFVYGKIKTQKIGLVPLIQLGMRSLSYMGEKKAKT